MGESHSCACGGDCACGQKSSGETDIIHSYCVTCGEEHGSSQELFDHNEREHRVPEPNHCPVCGVAIRDHVEGGGQEERRTWLQTHLREEDERHERFVQTQPAGKPRM